MRFEISNDPLPDPPEPPEGGWREPTCSFDSHSWALEVEDGRANVICTDPCDPDLFDPAGRTPTCLADWMPGDFHTPEPIPVVLTFVDDSTPSGPWGPAEYGYYIEVRVKEVQPESYAKVVGESSGREQVAHNSQPDHPTGGPR